MAQKNIHSIILREKNSSNKTQAPILFGKKKCECTSCTCGYRGGKEIWKMFAAFFLC